MSPDVLKTILFLAVAAFVVQLILYFLAKKSAKKYEEKAFDTEQRFRVFQNEMEPLKKYQHIIDAEAEAQKITDNAKQLQERVQLLYREKKVEAEAAAESLLKDTRIKAREIREKADEKLREAHELANKIESNAQQKAEEIAGAAWEAKQGAEQYEATAKAMKNIIKGYGDEYLIPSRSVLDELAEEYDHKEAGRDLAKVRKIIKSMIKNGEAAECDYVEPYRKATAIEFVLDAFNGKIDTIIAKAKHDNYGKLLQEVNDAFRLVNHNGQAFRNARITSRYFDTIVEQLNLVIAVRELKRIDQEEQRAIREQMRDEEKAIREFQKAQREAEKEARMLHKAMVKAEKKLAEAAAEERAELEDEITKLKQQLAEADERGQRAISMAQQTKQGHVYIISNIGSFGNDVLKIGLTRRLEPDIRVRELGDASVPFAFDIHAMIHSDDAPALEHELHQFFESHRVNKVNTRKEFFQIPLSDVKKMIEGLGVETHWTLKAEALEYRESLQIKKRMELSASEIKN